MTQPDLFTQVHKGIRNALFGAAAALGRAGDDPERQAKARALLRDALRFVIHHGENEDLLLAPLLAERAPSVHERMRRAHEGLTPRLEALLADAAVEHASALYPRACELVAHYLEHMREEEEDLEPQIRAAVRADELAAFGRASVERTAPADQRMMLAFMLPAMTRADVEDFLGRLPPELAAALRPLAAD
jgi:hypothetical protein